MTEAQAIGALKQRWLDTWPGLQASVPFAFEGETIDSADAWVRVTIRPTTRTQATMGPTGGRRYEDRGRVFVQVFTDASDGETQHLALVESVRAVFEGRLITVGSEEMITFEASRRGGPDGQREGFQDGRWVMSTVSIRYWFDETK